MSATSIEKVFWLVWNPAGGPPTHEHQTEESAIAEAKRLARLNRGQKFVVLRAITHFVVDDMQRVDYEERDDLPF
jgi:hypothetical protein